MFLSLKWGSGLAWSMQWLSCGWTMEGPQLDSWQWQKIVLLSKTPRLAKGPTESRIHQTLGGLFLRGRRSEHEFNNSFNLVPRSRTSDTVCPLPRVSLWCACFYFNSYLVIHSAEGTVLLTGRSTCIACHLKGTRVHFVHLRRAVPTLWPIKFLKYL